MEERLKRGKMDEPYSSWLKNGKICSCSVRSTVDVASGPDALGINGLIIGHSEVHSVLR